MSQEDIDATKAPDKETGVETLLPGERGMATQARLAELRSAGITVLWSASVPVERAQEVWTVLRATGLTSMTVVPGAGLMDPFPPARSQPRKSSVCRRSEAVGPPFQRKPVRLSVNSGIATRSRSSGLMKWAATLSVAVSPLTRPM